MKYNLCKKFIIYIYNILTWTIFKFNLNGVYIITRFGLVSVYSLDQRILF